MRIGICAAVLLLVPVTGVAQQPAAGAKETFQNVCGACHPVETITGQRRGRAQWQESINAMVARGAKGTDEELAAILEYLTTQFGPAAPGGRGAAPGAATAGGRGRGAAYMPGSADKHVVDEAAANRGRKVYAAECINCHGTHARGTDNGADLVRSEIVLHDRYGSTIGPFLKKGHPTQTTPVAGLTASQIEDLSHTIHQEVYNTLRSALEIQNVLTGDAKAGADYFNGAGGCASCHSPTGDLAHIASRMSPPALQQRFLFPGGRGGRGGGPGGRGGPSPNAVTVTVTPASGAAVNGVLLHLDDFNVALRDQTGEYRSFQRTAALKVVKHDPAQAHHDLLDKYTDKNMHDIVAYLETLK
jgi:cytochrome c oxidase cbb3-type subunit III